MDFIRKMKGILFKFVAKVLASSLLTFGLTFGILFSAVFVIQFWQGRPIRVMEVEPVSLLVIPVATAMLMLCLRFALLRRYSRIRP